MITDSRASPRAIDFTNQEVNACFNSLSTSNLPSEKLIYNSQVKTKISKSTLSSNQWKKTHKGKLNFHHHTDLLLHLFALHCSIKHVALFNARSKLALSNLYPTCPNNYREFSSNSIRDVYTPTYLRTLVSLGICDLVEGFVTILWQTDATSFYVECQNALISQLYQYFGVNSKSNILWLSYELNFDLYTLISTK